MVDALGRCSLRPSPCFQFFRLVIFVVLCRADASTDEQTDLSGCREPSRGLAWLSATFRRYRSNFRGAYAQLRGQLGNNEVAEVNFQAASLVDPCNPWPHFNLATLKTKKGDYEGAEASYAAVVQVDPRDQLARLLYDKIRQQRAQAEFWGHMVAIVQDNPDITVTDQGLLDIPREHSARVKARLEIPLSVLAHWAPMRLVMNLDRISDQHLQELLSSEASAFEKECEGVGRFAEKLPVALQQVRDLENSTKWLVSWAVERLRYFPGSAGMSTGAYGITWFAAWKAVFARPSVASIFRQFRGGVTVVIIGSALGYQCFYALALGAKRCIGYEVLCNTMVSNARRIVSKNGLDSIIEYRCQDALKIEGLGDASLVWINDETFPQDLRLKLQHKVAADLEPGALAVSFAVPAGDMGGVPGLDREDALRVEVSWSYVAPIFIFRKLAPGQMPRPPPMPMPNNQRGRKNKKRKVLGFEL